MFVAVIVEGRESVIWVIELFEVGDERHWPAKKISWGFVRVGIGSGSGIWDEECGNVKKKCG